MDPSLLNTEKSNSVHPLCLKPYRTSVSPPIKPMVPTIDGLPSTFSAFTGNYRGCDSSHGRGGRP